MRPPIGKPLAFDARHSAVSALSIVHAKCNAVAVPEVELGKVAVKVLLPAMLIDALHSALEDREVAFDGVRMDG